MPPSSSVRLSIGDIVSVAVGVFGQEYARSRGAVPWRTETVRDEGVIVGKSGTKWKVKFNDGEYTFDRKPLAFVRRDSGSSAAVGARRNTARELDNGSDCEDDELNPVEDAEEQEQPYDSSSEEDEGRVQIGEPDHEGGRAAAGYTSIGEWCRDDDYGLDERAKHGYNDKSGPRLNGLSDWENASLLTFAKHFLPMDFVSELAALMQANGAEKLAAGQACYANWKVSTDDVLQWVGVWLYMLAFPQTGERRAYWEEPAGGYGPRHRLADYLRLGDKSDRGNRKGVLWFEKMQACFELPKYSNSASDPFARTRKWWDKLRDAFFAAVTCSWLIVMDESMVQWQGRGMPGLMVILRKPTPIGLELHTLCCAMCGVLLWFEVYEGKEAMEKKEFCDRFPKSVALTLRMLKPFFSSGRVLIADSWFGSVACALALFAHGIFAVMNVKTATKEYPKNELMAEVDEIKGKNEAARAARRARRGKHIAFTRVFKVGSRTVTLLAGGHNKKLPLLLISTYGSMLPGEEHKKTWRVTKADGSVEFVSLTTAQPQIHALYRKWMNIVDIHNKLRQGVASMADVWHTHDWVHRHFAEGLGFWEVNVFKALIYFYPKWEKLTHNEFRARLAWAFLTLGNVPYPADSVPQQRTAVADTARGEGELGYGTSPLVGGVHVYQRHEHHRIHRCAYCGRPSYYKCITCEANGLGFISICGPKASIERGCREKHASGEAVKHGAFLMRSESRERVREACRKRKGSDLVNNHGRGSTD